MTYLTSLEGFSTAELCALRLDGITTPAGEFLDTPDSSQTRALRTLRPWENRLVLTGFSAAWALGVGIEPARHTASYRHGRTYVGDDCTLIIEQRTFSNTDVTGLHTSPMRTILDVLRSSANENVVLDTVCALLTLCRIDRQEVQNHMQRSARLPYRHRALDRLRLLVEYRAETVPLTQLSALN